MVTGPFPTPPTIGLTLQIWHALKQHIAFSWFPFGRTKNGAASERNSHPIIVELRLRHGLIGQKLLPKRVEQALSGVSSPVLPILGWSKGHQKQHHFRAMPKFHTTSTGIFNHQESSSIKVIDFGLAELFNPEQKQLGKSSRDGFIWPRWRERSKGEEKGGPSLAENPWRNQHESTPWGWREYRNICALSFEGARLGVSFSGQPTESCLALEKQTRDKSLKTKAQVLAAIGTPMQHQSSTVPF